MSDQWILVPLDSYTNEAFALTLAAKCRAVETTNTPEGEGYFVPADLYVDGRPSPFIKMVENSVRNCNLKYSLYRSQDGGKPQKWNFSFAGRGKKRLAAKKKIKKGGV